MDLELAKENFTKYLKSGSYRITPERFVILEAVMRHDGHFDADELFFQLKTSGQKVSRATVYNTLDLLVDCDLVSRHQFGQNLAEYEKSYGHKQHDHLLCTECHKVVEFCDPRVHNIQKTVGELLGFEVMHHSLILYGNCKKENCENRPK